MNKNERNTILMLMGITFVCFMPMLWNQFTLYSDNDYVLNNPTVQSLSWKNIQFYFSSFFDGHYHPLTMLSLAVNYSISGEHAWSYQWTNLLLHIINVLLVYVLITKMFERKDWAWMVALLFALHPIHVESVARITERKDMLFSLFFFWSAIQYVNFIKTNKIKHYWGSLILFVLSLLSKGQAVTLAPTLFLFDYLFKRNFKSWKLWAEKLPFFILALIAGILTMYAQRYTGYLLEVPTLIFMEPILHAHYVLTHYLFKLILPIALSAYYPYPYAIGTEIPTWLYFFLLITPVLLFILFRYRKNRIIVFSVLFYIINIMLMIRIVPIATNMAPDRYNYISSFGFFILIVFIWDYFFYIKKKKIANKIVYGYIILLGVLTFFRVQVWHDGLTLWSNAQKHYPNDPVIIQNIGDNQLRNGNAQKAFDAYEHVLSLDSTYFMTYYAMSRYFKQTNDSISLHNLVAKIKHVPANTAMDLSNKANVFASFDDFKDAVNGYSLSLEHNPYDSKTWFNRANLLSSHRFYSYAVLDYSVCIKHKAYFMADALFFRSIAYFNMGQLSNAKNDVLEAISYSNKPELNQMFNQIVQVENLSDTTIQLSKKEIHGRVNSLLQYEAYPYALAMLKKYGRSDKNLQVDSIRSLCLKKMSPFN